MSEQRELGEAEIVYYATYVMRCEILRNASRESCILSTKIVGDLLNAMGLRALPIVAHVEVLNAAAMWEYTNGRMGTKPVKGDPATEPNGLAIAYHPEKNQGNLAEDEEGLFFGHVLLCCIGRYGRYLVDPSIDQSSRPMWNVHIPPMVVPFEGGDVSYEQFLDGTRIMVEGPGGIGIFYTAHIEDVSYQTALDWTEPHVEQPDIHEYMENVLALVNLAKEYGQFPTPPPLPRSMSSNALDLINSCGTMSEAAEILAHRGVNIEDVLIEYAQVAERLS